MKLQSNRILGVVVLLGGAMLSWMAIAAGSVPEDQLGDPLIGHLAEHTFRYLTLAIAALISGGVLFVIGGHRRAPAAQDDFASSD